MQVCQECVARIRGGQGQCGADARFVDIGGDDWSCLLSCPWCDVAAFSGDARAPLALEATGNLFGVFGEADEKALTAEITAEGKAVDPIPSGDPKGEFRIGSVCTATLVPNVVTKADGAEVTAEALERLDHARGQAW